jgi:hypothetical protein
VSNHPRRNEKAGATAGAGKVKQTVNLSKNRASRNPEMNDQPVLLEVPRKRRAANQLFNPKEFKLLSLRECPTPAEMQLCDDPSKAASYWREHVANHPYFNRDVECFVVLLVNTRRRIQGHCFISTGTLDTILVHPREVFRPAVIGAAAAIVIMHNHPSGVIPHPVLCRMACDLPLSCRSEPLPHAA